MEYLEHLESGVRQPSTIKITTTKATTITRATIAKAITTIRAEERIVADVPEMSNAAPASGKRTFVLLPQKDAAATTIAVNQTSAAGPAQTLFAAVMVRNAARQAKIFLCQQFEYVLRHDVL